MLHATLDMLQYSMRAQDWGQCRAGIEQSMEKQSYLPDLLAKLEERPPQRR